MPSSMLQKLFENWGLSPVGLLEDSVKGVEMHFSHECFLPIFRVWNFLTYGTELNWPVEISIFHFVLIFAQIHESKFVLEPLDIYRSRRLSSFNILHIDTLVEAFLIL